MLTIPGDSNQNIRRNHKIGVELCLSLMANKLKV